MAIYPSKVGNFGFFQEYYTGHKLTAISYLVILASLEGYQLIKANFATSVYFDRLQVPSDCARGDYGKEQIKIDYIVRYQGLL